jgi:outer membrane murein-binding lipoprotein Lpp
LPQSQAKFLAPRILLAFCQFQLYIFRKHTLSRQEVSKAEKNALFPHGKAAVELDEIREMIAGPPVRELEARIAALSQQVAQLAAQITADRARDGKKWELLQNELAEQRKKSVRRAARHRTLTTAKIKKLAQQLQSVSSWLESEQQSRAALAEAMAALSEQWRAAPPVYKIKRTTVADYLHRKKKTTTGRKKSAAK